MKPIRVMIVEDSLTARQCFTRWIDADPRLTVVGAYESAEQALKCLQRVAPDVISMDIHLPGMNGIDATQRVMETRPTPIVIISRSVNADDLDATMEALRAGAVSVVEKPVDGSSWDMASMSSRICRELAVMSQVKVVRQRFNHSRPASSLANQHRCAAPRIHTSSDQYRVLGVAASTGGPRAIQILLESLGPEFPLPIVMVQHMTASFQQGFVSWLDRTSPQHVVEGSQDEIVQPGHVYVAPSDLHMKVRGGRLAVVEGPPVSAQCPSATVLFQSLAESYGPRAIGALLTGMGDDGAEGLLSMKWRGAYTITEDESTSAVYGMPGVACQLGAECVSLPLESIGPAIRQLVRNIVEVRA
jgi:two-component system, chemotaxis family, protein-glutamate methylesterase/glutaminase